MPVITATARTDASATPRSSIPQSWLMWAGSVVIAAQLVAIGVVVSRQVEQAHARQVAMQSAAPAPVLAQQ